MLVGASLGSPEKLGKLRKKTLASLFEEGKEVLKSFGYRCADDNKTWMNIKVTFPKLTLYSDGSWSSGRFRGGDPVSLKSYLDYYKESQ